MEHNKTSGNPVTADTAAHDFIARWKGVAASELSTSQSFVIALCELLGVAPPHPTPEQDYMFERPITFRHGDGSTSPGRVDCYRRGHFVWESKKLKAGIAAQASGSAPTKAFDDALLRARQQAEDYARALPASEGRPPFVVVVDVGHVIELYAEFTRSGATYTPFPDPRSHRIRLDQLTDPAIRERLKALWTDPLSLDPSRISAKVTRRVAAELAELAKSLEAAGHAPQQVAAFLTRCLFSMFAEDVGLLPVHPDGTGSFVRLLTSYREQPAALAQMLKGFWQGMDEGGFNLAIGQDVLRFNGKLFKGAAAEGYVLPLTTAQIDGLLRAAQANWQEVEPAIFGTLLERALDPTERHALGAHYTPRAYVERLVLPTVVEPLRADWAHAQAAAVLLAREAAELEANPPKRKAGKTHDTFDPRQLAKETKALVEHERKVRLKWHEARQQVLAFHEQLCNTRVLDPACGSGNFLYVTLEHLKRLEGEVLNQLSELGQQTDVVTHSATVTLKQFLGIELNPRAAALAELVLWIGWLQWQVRTQGSASVPEPVVHDYGNIEHRDAVLAYDAMEPALDADGKAITRWDGATFRKHPVTGEDVPDETAQVVQWKYLNPRPAEWPAADFIVGNPPFIGKGKALRDSLGDGYVEALSDAWTDVPDGTDFVAYWWHKAAQLVGAGKAKQFGFITTNSIKQHFNRRVLVSALTSKKPIHLAFAIPDHPWVDSANGAAVRIAMTVGLAGTGEGKLLTVADEQGGQDGEVSVSLTESEGLIHPDLRVGANVAKASRLLANLRLTNMGYILGGRGFLLKPKEAAVLAETGHAKGLIHILFNGDDVVSRPRGVSVVDCHGLSEGELRERSPAVWQLLRDRVYPERVVNPDPRVRANWWLFRRTNEQLRAATARLDRFIVTSETAKHRIFTFIEGSARPEHKLVVAATSDALLLGVMSSATHVTWAIAAGSTLEDRPVYVKTSCFEKFPFPSDDTGLTPALADRIRQLAEQLDAHRKARQAAHEAVTLTGLYNVLDKLRRGEALNAKDKLLHEQGLVSVLQSLHDELDAAVLQAYGWSDLGPVPWSDEAARAAWTEALLERLVALNAQRAAEEATGKVRWLRPEFQDPAERARRGATTAEAATPVPQQSGIDGVESKADAAARAADAIEAEDGESDAPVAPKAAAALSAQPWPSTLPEQVRAVAQLLAASPAPLALPTIEAAFKGKGPWKKGLPRILETLEALGRARQEGGGWRG